MALINFCLAGTATQTFEDGNEGDVKGTVIANIKDNDTNTSKITYYYLPGYSPP